MNSTDVRILLELIQIVMLIWLIVMMYQSRKLHRQLRAQIKEYERRHQNFIIAVNEKILTDSLRNKKPD